MATKSSWALAVAMVLVGTVLAQPPAQRPARRPRGQVKDQAGVPLKKARPNAADPLGKAAAAGAPLAPGTYHFNFRLHSFDGAPLAASYYRSKLGSDAPVVMLIHESSRSRKDFEDPVSELKGQGLAENLQGRNYAVLSLDLRGQGQNPRRPLTRDERTRLVEDLQAAYFFLVDRHNRGDLNLAKLGVIALGDGANLTAAWAYQPGAAITIDGRPSDLSALALISPMPEGSGYVLRHVLASLAPRVPILLQAGERDHASKDALQTVRPLVERSRLNKVELYPSTLHGYQLMRLEPKVTSTLFQFLDTALRTRAVDWEPQYNLIPVTFSDIQIVRNARAGDLSKDQPKTKDNAGKAAPAPPAAAAASKSAKQKASPKRSQPAVPTPPRPATKPN
jgi:pimeloyl-ACP methyl ester carboxylesterase